VQQSEKDERRSFLGDIAYAGTYLRRHSGLMSLMLLYGVCNFLIGIVSVLVVPMVLAFGSSVVLGTVLSVGGTGMLLGAILMSIWGGSRRRVLTVLGFIVVMGLCIAAAGLRPAATLIGAAAFGLFFSLSLINSSTPTIIQTKVDADIQGRVFALLTMIAWSAYPLAYPLAGPLGERVFEPLLRADGALAGSVGRIIGVGQGRGIALLFITIGALMVLIAVAGYLYPRLRNLEDEMPDAVVAPKTAPPDYDTAATAVGVSEKTGDARVASPADTARANSATSLHLLTSPKQN
jgi:MFS family permease